jgi:hypothetical protein
MLGAGAGVIKPLFYSSNQDFLCIEPKFFVVGAAETQLAFFKILSTQYDGG